MTIKDTAYEWAKRNEKDWSQGLPGWGFAALGFEAGAKWNEPIPPPAELRIILRAEDIPEKATVTKRTGMKKYILRHQIEIYGGPEGSQIIKPDFRQVFLVCGGSINAIYNELELVWYTTKEELLRTIL